MNDMIQAYWNRFLKQLPDHSPYQEKPYSAWGFGDSPQMANELGRLVQEGVKTATCSLLWEYEADGERLPAVGNLSIILDGEGQPLCITEIVEVTIRPYDEVDDHFAYDEGEGNRTLAYWRHAHWEFFSRVCSQIGREISPSMPLVCERFRTIYRKAMVLS
jgi:uncharacterized protein YhfF